MKIPSFIIVRDRIAWIPKLAKWLEKKAEVILVDNDSTYPPVVKYLDETKYKTYRLKSNHSKWAPWKEGLIGKHPSNNFIVCDPDMYPIKECPDDAIDHWIEGLQKYPQFHCVGPAYVTWDLPKHYAGRMDVVRWEGQYWAKPVDGGHDLCEYFEAPIDSMFAVFRKGGYIDIERPAGRSNYPYVMRHKTWYMNTNKPTAEQKHYISRCDPNRAHWVRWEWQK